jgi:hypothetical protein
LFKICIYLEVHLLTTEFILNITSNSCKAYLRINDSIDSSDFVVNRRVSSSQLTFASNGLLNNTLFEIIDGNLNVTDNPTKTLIDVEYSFISNSFSTVRRNNASLGKIRFLKKYLNTLTIHWSLNFAFLSKLYLSRSIFSNVATSDMHQYMSELQLFGTVEVLGVFDS